MAGASMDYPGNNARTGLTATHRCKEAPLIARRGLFTNDRRANYFIIAFLNIRSTFALASSAFWLAALAVLIA